MRMVNEQGQAVYYNCVVKHERVRYVVKAASGQDILGRDRQKLRSRTFAQEHQAEAWLKRNGYKAEYPKLEPMPGTETPDWGKNHWGNDI